MKKRLTAADKQYCGKCIYKGRFSAEYLCDYVGITGHIRGGKPGVGCRKRELEGGTKSQYGERICERCGAAYIGSKTSHYCPGCRIEAFRQNAKNMTEKRKKGKE